MARIDHGYYGIYNLTPITLGSGEGSALALNASGQLLVDLATKLAGEDLTADVMKVEQRCSYLNLSADTAVKATAGRFLGFSCNSTTAGTVKFWDNIAGSGTIIINTFTPVVSTIYMFASSVYFDTGLYADIANTIDLTVFYI